MKCLLCLAFFAASVSTAGERVDVGIFSAGDISGWETKQFNGETQYRLVEQDGRQVLKAESRASASGRYKRIRIDLARTPYLHWSWRVDGVLAGPNEKTRQGDDYPARIYVVFSGGMAFWNTRALNYVWSSVQAQASTWPNAFTGNAVMVAVRSGDVQAGRWLEERRDVRADARSLLGREVRYVDAVALMSDTDNTGQSASAYYGDIYFASE